MTDGSPGSNKLSTTVAGAAVEAIGGQLPGGPVTEGCSSVPSSSALDSVHEMRPPYPQYLTNDVRYQQTSDLLVLPSC